MPIIIGLTGEKLSGKGTISKYLIDKYQANHFRFSKILEDICERLYLPKTRENEIDVALALRSKFGNEILAHVLKKDIEKVDNKVNVIDGIRYWEEYHILKNLPGFNLVYVTASIENRYERVKSRHEKIGETNLTFADFQKQETAQTEIIIKDLAKDANFIINNNSTVEDLYSQIESIITKLSK